MENNNEKLQSDYVEPDNFPYFCEFELHMYAEKQNYEALKDMLDEFPSYVDSVNSKGYTPLAVVTKTIWESNTDTEKRIMELLLSYGADPMLPHFDGKPIALYAFRNGDVEVLTIFAKYLKNIDTYLEGCTPLHYAVCQCEKELAKYCLSRNADINQKYPYDTTLLHVAVMQHNYCMIPLLIEYGCDVNAEMCDGNTALHLAVTYNNGDSGVRELLKYNANMNVQNKEGDTPLNKLARQRYFNFHSFELLVKNGCDVNQPDFQGFTPLHTISYRFRFGKYDTSFKNSCKNFVRTLLKRGANVFALTHYDDTILDTALRNNRLDVAEIIIRHIAPSLLGRYRENDRLLQSFEKHPKFKSLAKDCLAELTTLDTRIPCTNFTYRDLAMNYRKLLKCTTNPKVAHSINQMIHRKRHLFEEELIEECIKVMNLSKMFTLLNDIFRYTLPELCIEKILEYLNPFDCAMTFRSPYNLPNKKHKYRRRYYR